MFSNKLDEYGIITKIKFRLVNQGYNQEECIDSDETFTPVARLETITMHLVFASFKNFRLLQMYV